MKNTILLLMLGLSTQFVNGQSTATNFNVQDCNAITHDFYSELDQGKVIVLDWIMPCSSCLLPSKTAYNLVQSYATAYPGKVVLYINDDYANTNCTSISGWVDNNGMPNSTKFSSAAIKMSDYGTDGMPKIIVVGGKNHTVYFNENDSEAGNANKLQNAINKAIEETNAIIHPKADNLSISINPNPADFKAIISLNLSVQKTFDIELLNYMGQIVLPIANQHYFSKGDTNFEFDTRDLASGFYFIKIGDANSFKLLKLSVSH